MPYRTLIVLCVAGFVLASAASADQDRRKLTPEESIIAFDMPGLKGGTREVHERWYTDSFGTLVHFAEQTSTKASGLPRALVRVGDVQRGFKFTMPDEITQKWLEGRTAFFRRPENAIAILSSTQSSNAAVREARFTAGKAHCYALSTFGDGPTHGSTLQNVGRRSIVLIYCGEPDRPLDDATLEVVKKGYRLKG